MSLQKLHSLVHQFNTHELTLIRYALKGAKDESGENKYLRLFEYVIKEHKTISRKAASMAIYHAMPDTRITKLAERLEEKILDFIISDSFLKANERIRVDSLKAILVAKAAMQAEVLHKITGTSVFYCHMLNEAISRAVKDGGLFTLTKLYRLKMNSSLFYGNPRDYDYCKLKMKYYEKCYFYEEKLQEYYFEIIRSQSHGGLTNPNITRAFLNNVIDKFKNKDSYIITDFGKYMLGQIKIEYFICSGKYTTARNVILKLLKELKGDQIENRTRINKLEYELGSCELYLGNYNSALTYLKKNTQNVGPLTKTNLAVQQEVLIYPLFYIKEFDNAIQIIDQLISDSPFDQNKFRKSKPKYFKACVHFQKTEFRETLKIINSPSPLNKDKTGYDIAIRILRIQSLVELDREDEASTQVENLRKHISRNYKKAYVRDRDKIIIRVLQQMVRRGFSGKAYKLESEMIQKLSLNKGNLKWMPLTPELIRFHEWYADWQSRKSKGVLS